MQPRQEPAALTDAPEMDGLGACRRIRALPGGGLPIIASTANALAGDRERCLAAGMDGYLTKPLEPEALDAELGRWLGRRSCATSVGSIHRSSPPQVGCPLLRVQVRRLFGLAVTAGVNLSPSHRWTAGSDWGSRVYRDSGSILIPRRRKVVAMIVPPFGSA